MGSWSDHQATSKLTSPVSGRVPGTHLSFATFCSWRKSFFRLCSFSCCWEAPGAKPQDPSSAARCSRTARSSWCCLISEFSSCQNAKGDVNHAPPADLGRGNEADSPTSW